MIPGVPLLVARSSENGRAFPTSRSQLQQLVLSRSERICPHCTTVYLKALGRNHISQLFQ